MSDETRVRARHEDVAWRRVENEVVLLDLRRNSYLTINASGIPLWEGLQADGATPGELAGRLVESFGISSEQADTDVAAFLGMLEEKGLLG